MCIYIHDIKQLEHYIEQKNTFGKLRQYNTYLRGHIQFRAIYFCNLIILKYRDVRILVLAYDRIPKQTDIQQKTLIC